jgi:hypothetical protein
MPSRSCMPCDRIPNSCIALPALQGRRITAASRSERLLLPFNDLRMFWARTALQCAEFGAAPAHAWQLSYESASNLRPELNSWSASGAYSKRQGTFCAKWERLRPGLRDRRRQRSAALLGSNPVVVLTRNIAVANQMKLSSGGMAIGSSPPWLKFSVLALMEPEWTTELRA